MNYYLKNKIQKLINETLEDKANEVMEKLKLNKPGSSFDYVEEGEMCESCGGEMSEGECMECGNMYEGEMCESCGGEMTEGECRECGGEMRENDEMDFETPIRDAIRSHKGKFRTPMRDSIRSNKGKFKTPMRDAMAMRSRKNRHNDVEDDMNEGVYPEMREQDNAESRNTHNRTKDDEIIHNWLDNGKHTLKGKRDGEKFNAHSYETDSTDEKTKEWYQGHYDKIKGMPQEYKTNDDSFFLPGFGEISTYASDEGELDEKFYGNQRRLDKNKNGRLDSQDFKMLRKDKKEDVNENVFYELTTAVNGKREKLLFNESQFEEMIENIVLKEEGKFNKGKTPAGYAEYERSIKTSKKNEEGYMKDLTKKMKDYLKDGSKGKYEMSPKNFPKGNGELEEMSKKAYVASGAIEDYIDNFTAAGLENLDYDEIHPDEDWVTDNVVGSSRTGNNPEWANAVETPNNEKRNKIRKDNLLAKIKRKAYNKAPQPVVTDKSGENAGDKIMTKLESIDEKKKQKINEDYTRILDLMSYKKSTQ